MAHHVQKKGAAKHERYRPRKHRPSDINRKPPSYPELPTIDWMTKLESLSSVSSATVQVEVEPSDTADSLRSKITAAGGESPESFVFAGKDVTGTLADCGLTEPSSIEARVVSS